MRTSKAVLGVDECGPRQRAAIVSNSACHREPTAAGVAPQTPPLGPAGMPTGQPRLGAPWGGGGGGRRAPAPRSTVAAFGRAARRQRGAWSPRGPRGCVVLTGGRGADRIRGRHASHPELSPALPLGSDFITAVSLSEPPRASIRGARRRPAVAAPPHGSGRAPREQVPAALRLTAFICPLADGRWFQSRGPRGPGCVDAPGLTWRPGVLRPKRGDKRGGSRDPDVRWLVGF